MSVQEQLPPSGPRSDLNHRRRRCGHGDRGAGRVRRPAPPCSASSARPHSRGEGRDPGTAGGNSAPSADVDTRPLPAETGKLDNVAPGHCSGHGHSQSQAIAQAVPAGRGNFPTAHQLLKTWPGFTTQACPLKSSGNRTRPATSPPSKDSGGLANPRSLERVYRGGEMNALNGDPGARAPSHRRSGTKDPLPARSEAPGDEGTRGDAGRPELAAATTPGERGASPPRITAGTIFSTSRRAQVSEAPELSPPVMPASGALRRVCRLNRSPCEGRRKKAL